MPTGEDGIYFGIRYLTISPQTVRFLQTDSTFSWIYVEAADGRWGWFQMDGGKVKDKQVVGMGRLIGDGMYYTIVDIVVQPAYQKMGIGSK